VAPVRHEYVGDIGRSAAHEPRFLADELTGEELLLPTDDATERSPVDASPEEKWGQGS
jgi:hypothetical protein